MFNFRSKKKYLFRIRSVKDGKIVNTEFQTITISDVRFKNEEKWNLWTHKQFLISAIMFYNACLNVSILHIYVSSCKGMYQFSSVAQLYPTLHDPMDCSMPGFPVHQPTPGAFSNSCTLSQWCHPTISSFVIPFSSRLQSFPASGSFPVSQFFESGGQNFGASASASVLTMYIQDWSPLGLTGFIFLQSKGLSRFFFNTTVQKHQFFNAQLSLWPNSHIHTWLLVKR